MKRLAAVAGALGLTACTPQQYIDLYFEGDAPDAARVADCESRMQSDAVSPGGGNHGLFQINVVHRPAFERVTGQSWSSAIYHAGWNTMFASWLFDQQGWRPWSCAR
jgi:hypothetical protein